MFYKKVYSLLKKVPGGRVTTYSAIAKALHSKAYRAVGTAVKKNKHPKTIPCFKVVKSNGELGKYSAKGGIKTKIRLLEKEGIKVKNSKIVDFKKKLYKFKKIKI